MRNFNKNIEIFFEKLIIIGMVDFDEKREIWGRKCKLMKIKIIIFCLIACLLTGCTSVVEIARYIHDSDKIDDYIYGDAKVANEYIEKIVQALNTNDRELLVSLFPEYARSKIDNFDEKIDNIFRGYNNNKFSGKIIRYKLNEDNDYESSSDKGKLQKKVYASTTIEFADDGGEYNFPIQIYFLIRPVDDFHENNVGISKFAIDSLNLHFLSDKLDLEKDGYDIYAFGH